MKGKYHSTIITLLIFALSVIFFEEKQVIQKKTFLENHFNREEISYIHKNDIDVKDIEPYLQYQKFNIFKYHLYQEAREKYNFTYLESINYVNNPDYYHFYHNPQKALFVNTSYVLVNKCYYLDKDFVPKDLVNVKLYDIDCIVREDEEIYLKKEVLESYQLMFNAAKGEGVELMVFSGYRSYQKQKILYNYVYGQDDTISARPGFSEHQTGYAVDISRPNEGLTEFFEQSKSFSWLMDNCYKYGFILRFPHDKENKTGYAFEPWHFRYVGPIAEEIHLNNLTLEEYLFSNLEI
ncbi:MAG: M15 family metallopeptidase [Bacilli bacterium]|nr:M15 family metallopeptidase [Bacilli bacterium]MDD4077200.1 M15 family metallopeptidase [Bacilli bacterium]MDD4387677.1 M15 family metallopeptidase [Bacilli bacterium]